MLHLSTLMRIINLVNKYVYPSLGLEVRKLFIFVNPFHFILGSGVEAGKKAAGEVLALQKRVLAVLNEARYVVNY